MEGHEVVTPEDKTVGTAVEKKDDYLIVEHGHLRKTRHAVPCATVEIDDAEEKVRTSLSRELIESSPQLDDGALDQAAVDQHYGLAGSQSEAPPTEGYGVTDSTDPARSAEDDAIAAGLEPGAEERARIQKGDAGSGLPEESPGLLGDRVAGIDEQAQRD